MSYVRIAGFNDRGEARLVDENGQLVGWGELRLEDAHIVGVDVGDEFPAQVKVVWTKHEALDELP